MNLDDILEVDVPENVSDVSSNQLAEWYELAEYVQGMFHRIEYYEGTNDKANQDKRVRQAERAIDLRSKAGDVKSQIEDEIQRRELNIDDRDRINATYVDDSGLLTYVDPERRMKIRIEVEDVEYRLSEDLGQEVMADSMYGKDVHVETEALAPDRFLIVADDGPRKAQIEVTGETTTHVEG
ncbi:hypothetical protein [Halolamina sp. C58]|uniref:hypothetical protein n=1 Tax=Halolamina sp. C58 TaxID=3421640 RepID=UPI003EC0E1EB